MAETRSGIVVCDAGPIIHLDELACLPLLRDHTKVLISETVRLEVLTHRPQAMSIQDVPWEVVREKYPLEEPLKTLCRLFSLDAGEIEALSFSTRKPGAMFLTDDAAARLVAAQLGLNVHGTIGILIRSIRRKLMDAVEVIEILRSIPIKSSLHIRPPLLKEVIARVEKASDFAAS